MTMPERGLVASERRLSKRRLTHLGSGLLAVGALVALGYQRDSGFTKKAGASDPETIARLVSQDYSWVQAEGRKIMHSGYYDGMKIQVMPGEPPVAGERQVYQFAVKAPDGSIFEALGVPGDEPIGTTIIPAAGPVEQEDFVHLPGTNAYEILRPAMDTVDKIEGNKGLDYNGQYVKISKYDYLPISAAMQRSEIVQDLQTYVGQVESIMGENLS